MAGDLAQPGSVRHAGGVHTGMMAQRVPGRPPCSLPAWTQLRECTSASLSVLGLSQAHRASATLLAGEGPVGGRWGRTEALHRVPGRMWLSQH